MCEHVLIMDICLFVLVRTVRQVNKQIIGRFCLNFRLSVSFKRNVHTHPTCVCLCDCVRETISIWSEQRVEASQSVTRERKKCRHSNHCKLSESKLVENR